jgi:hypothetical protein
MDGAEVKRQAKQGKKAALEQSFLTTWKLAYPTLPAPTLQYHFHPERKWRFDFSWPDHGKVAVEIQGGSFVQGGHNRGAQQAKDYEKQREAVRLGWRVLPFNTLDCRDMMAVVNCVAEILTDAKPLTESQP